MKVFFTALVAIALFGSPALADSGDQQATAEALFIKGRNLMEAEKFAEACEAFEASQRLDPGLGTMLNLAACYEKVGRTASAWAEYREAIPAARAAGSPDREELARSRARDLESRLSVLTVRLMGEMAGQELEVRRNGLLIDRAALSTPIPVDPGEQKITAVAPGRETFELVVKVGPDGDQVDVSIPELAPKAGEATPAATQPSDSVQQSGWHPQKTWAVVSFGVGVVGVGVGAVTGAMALSNWNNAQDGCVDLPYDCSSTALDQQKTARTMGTVSTIGFITGGVGLALGTVLWFTVPRSSSASGQAPSKTRVGVGPQSIYLQGAF